MAAGKLRLHRLRFEARELVSDEYGNEEGGFQERLVRSAEIIPQRGGEAVQAARLSGTQPVIIRVRRDSDTLQIDAAWQAVDVHTGQVYAVTSPATDMEQKRQYLSMQATIGVAP